MSDQLAGELRKKGIRGTVKERLRRGVERLGDAISDAVETLESELSEDDHRDEEE